MILIGALSLIFFVPENREREGDKRKDHLPAGPPRLRRLAERLSMPEWTHWFAFGALLAISTMVLFEAKRVVINFFDVSVLALSAWATLSLVWAENRMLSGTRLFKWLVVCVSAFFVAASLSFAQCALLVASCGGLYLTVGLVEEISAGCFLKGTSWQYRFSGTLHPNKQSKHCVLFGFSVAYLLRIGYLNTAIGLSLIGAALTLLWLTRTRGATWGALLGGTMWLLYETSAWIEMDWWLSSLALLIVLTIVCFKSPRWRKRLFQGLLLGRPGESWRTLTTRTHVWKYTMNEVSTHPFLGFGFGGFWDLRRSKHMADRLHRHKPVYSSWSLYLETLVNTGVIGLLLLTLVLITAGWTALNLANPEGGFMLAIVSYLALQSVLDGSFMLPTFRAFSFWLLLFNLS